jgi:type I restriction enzyme, S subunit
MGSSIWKDVSLGAIAAEVTVGHVGPMASEYVEEGIPFLRSQNVERLRIKLADVKFISPEFHAKLKKSALSPGDVVIVRTGKPGACAVMPESLPVSNCSDLVIVRPGPNLDPRFLAYYINSQSAHDVTAYQVGAVQQHFNVESARNLKLNLPPLKGQQAIVHILGTLDDKIELNRRMNETLGAMARAIFKSWFVDFDPVRAKMEGRQPFGMDAATAALFPDSFQDSPLGKIPKGWQVDEIRARASRIQYGLTQSASEEPIGPRFLRITDIQGGRIDWQRVPHCEVSQEEKREIWD